MGKKRILLSLGLLSLCLAAPAAASEAIKGMARTPNGPGDNRHCIDVLLPLDKRIDFCSAAIREGSVESYQALAELDRRSGNFDEALAALKEITSRLRALSPNSVSKLDEDWEPILALRSQIYAQMGRFDDAKADAVELDRIAHRASDGQENECLIRAAANRELEEGLAACNKAVDRRTREDYLTARAAIEYRMGRLEDAQRDFDAALDQNGHFAPAFYGRGVIKSKRGDAAGAKEDLDAATARDTSVALLMAAFGLTP